MFVMVSPSFEIDLVDFKFPCWLFFQLYEVSDKKCIGLLNSRDWFYEWMPTFVMLPPILATAH